MLKLTLISQHCIWKSTDASRDYDVKVAIFPLGFRQIEWSRVVDTKLGNRHITPDAEKFKQRAFSRNEVIGKFIEGAIALDVAINQIFGRVMNKSRRVLRI
jgi:hypothetical protein